MIRVPGFAHRREAPVFCAISFTMRNRRQEAKDRQRPFTESLQNENIPCVDARNAQGYCARPGMSISLVIQVMR